jgi:hypothetical protein
MEEVYKHSLENHQLLQKNFHVRKNDQNCSEKKNGVLSRLKTLLDRVPVSRDSSPPVRQPCPCKGAGEMGKPSFRRAVTIRAFYGPGFATVSNPATRFHENAAIKSLFFTHFTSAETQPGMA